MGDIKRMTPEMAVSIIDGGGILHLDVRNREEYAAVHIAGTVNVPVGELEYRLDACKDFRNRPILVSCLSGGRSMRAAQFLSASGFTDVANLDGGIAAWNALRLPVDR